MKNTKKRKLSDKALLARANDQFERAMGRVREIEAANRNIAKQRDHLVVQSVDVDRRFRALLWALELAHKENGELRSRLDFLQTPEELAKRDKVAIAS